MLQKLLILKAFLLISSIVYAIPEYTLQILDNLPGYRFSYGYDINDLGHITGRALTGTSAPTIGYFWSPATGMVNLGSVGGIYPNTWGYSLNNFDQVTGYVSTESETDYRGFIWDMNKGIRRLPEFQANRVSALGINDSGYIVGTPQNSSGIGGSLWEPDGTLQTLSILPGGRGSVGRNINASGQIVGVAGSGPLGSIARAVRWESTGEIMDLGVLPGHEQSHGEDINNQGWVAGWSRNAALEPIAILWTPGDGMQNLGSLPGTRMSFSSGINDAGVVVGHSYFGSVGLPFIWDAINGMRDLNLLIDDLQGATLGYPHKINNQGQIVGTASIGGQYRPYILNPIPEPATVIIFGGGLGAFLYKRRKKTNISS